MMELNNNIVHDDNLTNPRQNQVFECLYPCPSAAKQANAGLCQSSLPLDAPQSDLPVVSLFCLLLSDHNNVNTNMNGYKKRGVYY